MTRCYRRVYVAATEGTLERTARHLEGLLVAILRAGHALGQLDTDHGDGTGSLGTPDELDARPAHAPL